jgi:transcriptional regulator with XRE-family HTH domain
MLAGVSADYYVRLEQGRDQHPSAQVLDALARVLRLDQDASAHLHTLAKPPAQRPRRISRPERAPEAMIELIMSWPSTPAYIFGRYLDVIAPTRSRAHSRRGSSPARTSSEAHSSIRDDGSSDQTGSARSAASSRHSGPTSVLTSTIRG